MAMLVMVINDSKNVVRNFLQVVDGPWLFCFTPKLDHFGLLVVSTDDEGKAMLKQFSPFDSSGDGQSL